MDARASARLGLLYEAEAKGCTGAEVLADLPVAARRVRRRRWSPASTSTASRSTRCSREHAKGWTLARMPALDRAVLRMGTDELITRPMCPPPSCSTRPSSWRPRFSTDDSGRFVNGLLAKIATEVASRVIPLPDPPAAVRAEPSLAAVVLAARGDDDAPAWSRRGPTPRSSGGPRVPERRDLAAAERWIAGDD